MKAINRFLAWWLEIYRKRGCFGRVVFVIASLFVFFCIFNLFVGILRPQTSSPATDKVVSTSIPTHAERPTEVLPLMTATLQQSASTPNNVCVFCHLECPA